MLTVGLTGDVGAGKSTLSRVWEEMGATVIDADRVARNMWMLPDVQKKAAERWGGDFFSGGNKTVFAKIAEKIFSDEEEYKFVSGLLHPATISAIEGILRNAHGWIVVEIPLLFECGRPEWIDCVVYASASAEKRAERNVSRGWDAGEILRREIRLMSREEKIKMSDWVLENSGSMEEWESKARELGYILIERERYSRSDF
ncbi:MAG: dephospho-CoA kinase [Synergistaceae bacterium]|nr:dephospho-CoA kinase [Synergistaceae bacterium]